MQWRPRRFSRRVLKISGRESETTELTMKYSIKMTTVAAALAIAGATAAQAAEPRTLEGFKADLMNSALRRFRLMFFVMRPAPSPILQMAGLKPAVVRRCAAAHCRATSGR